MVQHERKRYVRTIVGAVFGLSCAIGLCVGLSAKRYPTKIGLGAREISALAPAAFIRPRLPSRAVKAPSADGWIYEIKHDGLRPHSEALHG